MLACRSLVQVVSKRLLASSAQCSASSKAPTNETPGKSVVDTGHGSSDREVEFHTSGQTKINYNHDGVGFKQKPSSKHLYLNPLLTPPPRSPRTPEDFKNPARLGHWVSYGLSYTSPFVDKYKYHETFFFTILGLIVGLVGYHYVPDIKNYQWARREAFLRTAKREALGIPLIDRNLVDPERIVLPTEEELEDFPVIM